MGRTKKFIDKKKSATFQLLARDSSDPNYQFGPSSDPVFVRVDNNPVSIDSIDEEPAENSPNHRSDDPNSIFADAPHDEEGEDGFLHPQELNRSEPLTGAASPSWELPDHVRKEILELGFPDDGYNYLLHLREIRSTGAGSAFFENSKAKPTPLPLDVKAYDASRVRIKEAKDDPNDTLICGVAENTIGVRVQKAADPEVAALLDDSDLSRFGSDVDDDDDDDELEEDFVIQANVPEEGEDLAIENEKVFLDHDAGGCGTTMGVSLHPPEAGVFDTIMKNQSIRNQQYASFEPNEYDSEGDDGYVGASAEDYESLAHQLKDVLKDDFELLGKYKAAADVSNDKEKWKDIELLDPAPEVIQRCMEYAEKYQNEESDENVVVFEESSDESEAWDCETIISTYSNLDNHPGKIEALERNRKKKLAETVSTALSGKSPIISLGGKEKLPVEFLPNTKRAGKDKEKSSASLRVQVQKRKQHGQESKEERKERKAAVKEDRREARRVKKEMKCLFKSEAQHAQKVAAISCLSSVHPM